MKTVQEYFEANHLKSSLFINCEQPEENLEGSHLVIKDFPRLELLNVSEWKQIKKLSIENSPNLKSIQFSTNTQQPIIIQPEKKEIDWLCIIGFGSGMAAVFLHVYKWFRKKKDNEIK